MFEWRSATPRVFNVRLAVVDIHRSVISRDFIGCCQRRIAFSQSLSMQRQDDSEQHGHNQNRSPVQKRDRLHAIRNQRSASEGFLIGVRGKNHVAATNAI
jgi:hypothetical protein